MFFLYKFVLLFYANNNKLDDVHISTISMFCFLSSLYPRNLACVKIIDINYLFSERKVL